MLDDLQGYRGSLRKLLENQRIAIGDVLRVRRDDLQFEGTLMPRLEFGDTNNITLKLRNGYNVGITITDSTKVEFLAHGSKPSFSPPPEPLRKSNLPSVVIISTGGTIASRVDYRTGAVNPALSASDLYTAVPELSSLANVEAEVLFSLLSENIAPTHWRQMAEAITRHVEKGASGIVLAHGTDTMGYTAAALSFALHGLSVPVVIVGSQRSSDRPSSDAASNLTSAVLAAGQGPFAEVVLAMHETLSDDSMVLHRGTKVRKCHTSRRDAFQSVNAKPIGRIQSGILTMLTDDYLRRNCERSINVKAGFEEKVALVASYPGLNPGIFDFYLEKKFRGIIIEGTGLGHISRSCFDAIGESIEQGLTIGMTSQCLWGELGMTVYDTGRDLMKLGVIPLGDMLPEVALVKMMWTLSQTQSMEEARRILTANIAGEFAERRFP